MKKNVSTFLVIAAALLVSASTAFADFRTSTGADFSPVQGFGNGQAWREPNGQVWSGFQGLFGDRDSASLACARVGAALATANDYARLMSYLDRSSGDVGELLLTDLGKSDLYTLFPDMRSRWFWTATLSSDGVELFNGNNGAVFNYDNENLRNFPIQAGVHCIR